MEGARQHSSSIYGSQLAGAAGYPPALQLLWHNKIYASSGISSWLVQTSPGLCVPDLAESLS